MAPVSTLDPGIYDPLLQAVPLPLSASFYPLGFPLELATNSQTVLEAAASHWAAFPPSFSTPPIRLRVAVAADGPSGIPAPPAYRGQAHLLLILSDQANFAVCDYTRSFAYCALTPGALVDPGWFRYYYLEAVAGAMLAQLYLVPLHAACVARDGRGVLLCGDSGAGKSSLAFACATRGWTYIADDASCLLKGSRDRTVLGRPFQFRFRESAGTLFPELRGRFAGRDRQGKMTIEVRTQDLPAIKTALRAQVDRLVFLDRRSSGSARISPVSGAGALDRILRDFPLYDPPLREEQAATVRRLVEPGAFELCYAGLDSAVAALDNLVGGRE